MKAFVLLAGSGCLVILTYHSSIEDQVLQEKTKFP